MNKLQFIFFMSVCCLACLFLFNPFMMFVVPIVIFKDKPKPHAWARWMKGRNMRKNDNNLIAVVGRTGSGKTWCAMSICEIMSRMDGVPFDVDHIVFSLTELMELINSNKLKRGSKIVFDEPQISIGAREFQSEANKVFNFLISTFRHRNFSLFFCTPFEKLLDKSTRRLFHAKFETISINPNKQTCRVKPRYLEHSDFKEQPYRKQLLVVVKDKRAGKNISNKVAYWDVPKPSQELIDKYEQKKRAFTDRLNKNIYQRLQDYDKKKGMITSEGVEPDKIPLNPKSIQPIVWVEAQKGYYNQQELAKRVGEKLGRVVSQGEISRAGKSMYKKGYEIGRYVIKREDITQNS
jgi:ABC-type oligopeptide transport system ATPase subunit